MKPKKQSPFSPGMAAKLSAVMPASIAGKSSPVKKAKGKNPFASYK